MAHRARGPAFRRGALLLAGPLLALLPLLVPAPAALEPSAWRLVGLMAWMVLWWLSEVVPIPATSLLPFVFMPVLGIMPESQVAANYANPLVFLFLGGFFIAGALGRWGLHRRIALTLVKVIGTRPYRIVAGVMLASAFLSMWISNTASAVMMYTVGLSLIGALGPRFSDEGTRRNFGLALMLGIAYSASIGGIGTLIGTPPNVLLAGFLRDTYGIAIDFQTWFLIGLPVVLILLPVTWVWLTRFVYPFGSGRLEGAAEVIGREIASLGSMSRGEKTVAVVFVLTALAWILRPQLSALLGVPVSDSAIAIAAALLLFALPVSLEGRTFALDWKTANAVSWDVLLLFGGGLALAGAFESTGLAQAIALAMQGFTNLPAILVMVIIVVAVMVLGEFSSNTASAATFLPIAAAVAVGMGADVLVFTIPVALTASANFVMPVATPPNAIVFGYEEMTVERMARAGLLLDVVAVIVILALLPLILRVL